MTEGIRSIEPLGESALLLRLGERIDMEVNQRVHAIAAAIARADLPGIEEIVPAYASLVLRYDPFAWLAPPAFPDRTSRALPWRRLARRLTETIDCDAADAAAPAREIEIPVRYGGADGPDLEVVARQVALSPEEVVARHAAGRYTVAMLGFAPGFAYLLGLDPRLEVARHADPRTRVPAGSVAIGGAQTGIYPRSLPGGWQLIGATDQVLFDAGAQPPNLLAPGDRVRFLAR